MSEKDLKTSQDLTVVVSIWFSPRDNAGSCTYSRLVFSHAHFTSKSELVFNEKC